MMLFSYTHWIKLYAFVINKFAKALFSNCFAQFESTFSIDLAAIKMLLPISSLLVVQLPKFSALLHIRFAYLLHKINDCSSLCRKCT